MVDNTPRVLAGRYEVGELVGRGGMAEVHVGHDTRLGRTVAIKVLRSDLADDPSFLARFRREAQSAAALNHPAIVAVYDTGEDRAKDGNGKEVTVPFIVMEFVEGHTVRDILTDGSAVPIEEAVEITTGVLSALEYSHRAGIVHRDIKPANVMITPTGAVKVMDFGIARAMADSAATMTQTNAVIGTAQYLSPEQARGETVDSRSDLYSTGCLLFELLTGRPPFQGDSPVAVAYQHVGQEPQRPSEIAVDVPEVLDRITLKALTKDRDHRYGTAAEFRADLEAALRGGQVSAPMVGAMAMGAQTTQMMSPPFGTQQMSPVGYGTQQWGGPPTAGQPPVQTPGQGYPTGPMGPGGRQDNETDNKKTLIWTLIAIAIAAVAAILIAIAVNNNGQQPEEPTTATVPEIQAGMSYDEACSAVESASLACGREIDEESEQEAGTTTGETSPAAGETVDEGETVTIFVSGAPGEVSVPNVAGKTQDQVRADLEAVGLELGETPTENSTQYEAGQATRSEPAGGSTVTEGDTITVWFASGTVTLPDMKGWSEDQVEAKLAELNLNSDRRTEQTDAVPEGTISKTEPGPGDISADTRVTYYVALPVAKTQIPESILGMTLEDAIEACGGVQVNCSEDNVVYEDNDQYEPGTVFNTDPAPGLEVDTGAQVTLYVVSEEASGDPSGGATGGGILPGGDG
ncbi:Stk1 family PASTA domain-containing Ser/Thr kinase [Myceligenerans salitolerans]|uniref:non-specific serine/threonine protein kinase n=1 Tax=Myceligenerans salitolerans TaxID=1230528 RepID=A0ABS3I6H0_9MICO|nr:Stk1 family PASTA domain-containing Ser/Thr kinase [Myceligenerans salitolerans]MBO0608221.1 Stk1 family PASTA domain-containing Ser/Thr kinase [Myceligenerans salitolerans]